MQLIYISMKPDELRATLPFVKKYMSFIDDIVVFAPPDVIDQFESLGSGIRAISEEELLSGSDRLKFASYKLDTYKHHCRINYMLRSRIAFHEAVGEEFIMADDDNRPLRSIDKHYYVNTLGSGETLYNAYTVGSLSFWMKRAAGKKAKDITPFDTSHISELALLTQLGMPSLMYSAHMPQIINKKILAESTNFLRQYEDEYTIEEWNTYFNFAAHNYPETFNSKIYETAIWPTNSTAFSLFPSKFTFENFYPPDFSHYGKKVDVSPYRIGGVFDGLPTEFDANHQDEINSEKISRLKQLHMEQVSPKPKSINLSTYKYMSDSVKFSNKKVSCSNIAMNENILHGPYRTCFPGIRKVEIVLSLTRCENEVFSYDMVWDSGQRTLHATTVVTKEHLTKRPDNTYSLEIEVDIPHIVDDYECRIFSCHKRNRFDIVRLVM